jgi:hypothetical membrane protein
VQASQDMLAQTVYIMYSVLPVMVGITPGHQAPYSLALSLPYLVKYLDALITGLNTEKDDANGIYQLFQLKFGVFVTDLDWSRIVNRFTNVEVKYRLEQVRG